MRCHLALQLSSSLVLGADINLLAQLFIQSRQVKVPFWCHRRTISRERLSAGYRDQAIRHLTHAIKARQAGVELPEDGEGVKRTSHPLSNVKQRCVNVPFRYPGSNSIRF
jgi:hypothetical protein